MFNWTNGQALRTILDEIAKVGLQLWLSMSACEMMRIARRQKVAHAA